MADVTVAGALPVEMHGVLAAVGCVGGALTLDDYAALLESQGLVVEEREDCRGASRPPSWRI